MSAGVEVDVGSAVVEYRLAAGQTVVHAADRVAVGALFGADDGRLRPRRHPDQSAVVSVDGIGWRV